MCINHLSKSQNHASKRNSETTRVFIGDFCSTLNSCSTLKVEQRPAGSSNPGCGGHTTGVNIPGCLLLDIQLSKNAFGIRLGEATACHPAVQESDVQQTVIL